MDHLSLVVSQSFNNKMSPQNLSIIFAPLLMIQSESEDKEIDFNQPTNILRYLLEVWPSKSGAKIRFKIHIYICKRAYSNQIHLFIFSKI